MKARTTILVTLFLASHSISACEFLLDMRRESGVLVFRIAGNAVDVKDLRQRYVDYTKSEKGLGVVTIAARSNVTADEFAQAKKLLNSAGITTVLTKTLPDNPQAVVLVSAPSAEGQAAIGKK